MLLTEIEVSTPEQENLIEMKNSSTAELEFTLKTFVSWSLEQSYANNQPDANLQILDCAWKAQKLLWKLRHSSAQ